MKRTAVQVQSLIQLSTLFGFALAALPAPAADWPQWRGPERTGISSDSGLLQEWPKEGPRLLWTVTNLGAGYASPAVVGDRLYVCASEGMTNEYVAALAVKDGVQLWTRRLGEVGTNDARMNFAGARSTPTVEGEVLYALSSAGDLACLETVTGKPRWQRNLRADFGGQPGLWAYAESPLIDGDTLVCTPGGRDATLVALNKRTGEPLWKCAGPDASPAAFSSAIVVEAGGVKQYVQLIEKGLVGVDAKAGKLLWHYARPVSRYGANIPTPVAGGDAIYVASAGTGAGLVKVTAKDSQVTAEPVYFESKLPTAIGGSVKLGEHLYGTTAQALLCVDFASGRVVWEERSLGAASLCVADGRLILHGENGEVALVEPSPAGYREKGRFTPPDQPKHAKQMERAWAYPAVANGRLFLRDLGMLWCYAVK